MKATMDNILEGQKKVWDFWAETSRKTAEQFNGTFQPKKPKAEDYLGSWFEMQKKLWEEGMRVANLKEIFDQDPQRLQKWANMQTEFAQQWMDFYTQNVERLGVSIPKMNGASSTPNPFQMATPKQWTDWVEQSNKWMKDALSAKLPFPQNFHFNNFNELYNNMLQYWSPIQKMMQFDISSWNGMSNFIQPEAYQKIVGQFMGYKPGMDYSKMMEQTNELFDQYIGWLNDYTENAGQMRGQMKGFTEQMAQAGNPFFHVVLSMNEHIQEGLESFYNVAGQTKEVEMAKTIKDIQFAYIAFLMKTVDMQSMVYRAGQFALPDAIQHFSKKYQEDKALPSYQEFFNGYVNILEGYMIEVLESDEYSKLQADVAQTGIQVKSRMDGLIELAFADFPFLMQSHSDEVAVETNALRKKVRSLEIRLAEMEARLAHAPAGVPATSFDPQASLLASIGTATADDKDDLKAIKGIGPKLEDMLNSIGIYTFDQVSKMSAVHYQLVDDLLQAFQGRAQRDEWAKQAKKLI